MKNKKEKISRLLEKEKKIERKSKREKDSPLR